MLKNDPSYRRLKMGGGGVMNRSSFWLGPDHLLVVEVANYAERYRRFYFRDVQAILIQKTKTRWWWNLGLGIAFGLALVFSAWMKANAMEADAAAAFVWLGIALFLGVVLLINSLRGPTCTVLVRTAVQTQRLANLRRQRRAEELVRQLEPLIVAAQSVPVPPPAAASEPVPGPAPV